MDHEGGSLTQYGTVFPRFMSLGVIDDVELTEKVGRVISQEVASLGIDIIFSPVLDVNSDSDNTIIGARSFSHLPQIVSKHGIAFIKGVQSNGVIPVAKHFPGHGFTVQDSHIELPLSKDTDFFFSTG